MNDKLLGSDALFLTPQKSPRIDALLGDRQLLEQLTTALGSPLNILFPDQLEENVQAFKSILAKHKLQGHVCFAHKSNQSHSLIAQFASCDVNADIASRDELRHALGAGFSGARLEATGPKDLQFIALCIQHGVTINVDSLQEMTDIVRVRKELKHAQPVPVLLRLSGFKSEHTSLVPKQTRFGIPFQQLDEALDVLAKYPALVLRGFSFHLDTTSIDERVVAIENCLQAFEAALSIGLEPTILDIGGGFRVSYLENEVEWNRYITALKKSVLGQGDALTWQRNFFGLTSEGGLLRGNFNSYGYFEARPGALFLDDLLNAEMPAFDNQRVADVLRDNMIELWMEPGRALLDQCGVTIARVNSVKESNLGDKLVGLSMKRQDIAFLDQEVFVDPVVIADSDAIADSTAVSSKDEGATADGTKPEAVFFTGNLCLESDLIFRHKVFLKAPIKPGQLVAFINTAAYMMDFSSTNSIMHAPARRVAVVQDAGKFTWMLDEQYTPVWRLER